MAHELLSTTVTDCKLTPSFKASFYCFVIRSSFPFICFFFKMTFAGSITPQHPGLRWAIKSCRSSTNEVISTALAWATSIKFSNVLLKASFLSFWVAVCLSACFLILFHFSNSPVAFYSLALCELKLWSDLKFLLPFSSFWLHTRG